MKIKNAVYFVILIAGISLGSWVLYPTGSPGGKTGSPGDNFANCTECHLGAAPQNATGWITSDIPPTGYMPGQTYTITASATHPGSHKYGFEVTAEDDTHAKRGTFIITDAVQTQLVNDNHAVTHKFAGITPDDDSKTWSFDWTAPESGSGNITFYGAFNCANGNGLNTGDTIVLSNTPVLESSTGIEDNFPDLANIKVFPNPFSNYLYVSIKNKEKIREICLVSGTGTMVYSIKVAAPEDHDYRIPAATLPPGIYYLGIVYENGRQAGLQVIKR